MRERSLNTRFVIPRQDDLDRRCRATASVCPYEREGDLILPRVVLLSTPRLAVQRGRLGYKQLLVGQPELPSTLLHIGSVGI